MTSKTMQTARSRMIPPAALAAATVLLLAAAAPAHAQATDLSAAPGSLAAQAAASYRQAAHYPDDSRALPAGAADPVRARRLAQPHSHAGAGEGAPVLTVWAGAVSYEAPEPVELHATVEGSGPGGKAHGAVVATLSGEVVTAGGELIGTVTYRDDGEGADRRAGDGVYSALFAPPADLDPGLATSYGVRVHAVTAAGDAVDALDGFLYGKPKAHLTGAYRDAVVDGNLVIEAEVAVEEAGRFHLAATLGDVKGQPLGWAQTAAELTPGTHWLKLSFYGLMFRDRGAAGPFRLLSAALATTGAMPNALNDLVEDVHRTRAYPLARFTDRPFANPGLLQAAERLERAPGGGS